MKGSIKYTPMEKVCDKLDSTFREVGQLIKT